MEEREIDDASTCPGLECFTDTDIINMDGKTHMGLGAKKSVWIIISSLSKLRCLHFPNGFGLQNVYISF